SIRQTRFGRVDHCRGWCCSIHTAVRGRHRWSGGSMSGSPDIDSILAGSSQDLQHSSLHRRLASLASVQECCQAMSKPQTRVLARLILSSLCSPQYLERPWIMSLFTVLSFLPPAMCVVNLGGMVPSATDVETQLAILRVARALVEAGVPSRAEDGVPEWVQRLIVVQASVHERIGLGGNRLDLSRAEKILHICLKARPLLLDTYLEVLTTENRSGESLLALSAITSFAARHQGYNDSIKPRLLAVYVRHALLAKGGCDEPRLAAFRPLLTSLTSEDFSEFVRPVLEKLQKKNPDSILLAVASLVKHLRIDLSSNVGIFLPPLLRQLRSANEDVRRVAVELAGNLAKRCGDIEALESMITELSSALAGKSGVMAQWYQRHAFFMALEEVRRGIGSSQMSQERSAMMASGAVDGLLVAVDKESRDDTRAVGLGCLTRWALTLDTISPKLLASLKNGLASTSRPTVTMSAAAACELSGCARLSIQLAPLLPDLLGRVEAAAKKPNAYHPDAIYSSTVVLQVAAADDAWVAPVKNAFPWSALEDHGSFLFPAGILTPHSAEVSLIGEAAGPLAPDVCTALCRVLLLAAEFVVRQAKDDAQPFPESSSLALVQCMVLSSREVRRVALEAARRVCKLDDGAQTTLLRTCQQVVSTNAAAASARANVKNLPSSGKDDTRLALPPPNRFAAALSGIVGGSAPGSIFAGALLLSHHPLVCHSAKGAKSLWGGIVNGAFGGPGGVDRLLGDEGIAASVTSTLLDSIRGGVMHDRLSAQWALASLGSTCGVSGSQVVANLLFPALVSSLEDPDLRSVSVTDVDIFFTPAHVPYALPASQKKPVATVSKNAIRRGKDAEEAEWEERVRAEMGSKGKKQGRSSDSRGEKNAAGNPEAEAMAQVLAEERAVRERVRLVRDRAEASLSVLRWGFCSCPELGFLCIPRALPVLIPLMGWKLLEEEVQDCVEALASTVSKELPDCASRIASALRALQLFPGTAGRFALLNDCLDSIFEVCVSDVTGEMPLKQNTLALVFPILREVLSNPPSTAQCSRALKIVSIHANMEGGTAAEMTVIRGLRKFMIEGTLNVVERFPQMDPTPDVVLASICTAPALDASEWGPLLGNAGLLSEARHVRLACLESVMMMVLDGQTLTGDPLVESRLWLCRFDADEENAELAHEVWDARGTPLLAGFAAPLVVLLSDRKAHVRESTARALAGGMLEHPASGVALVKRLYSLYKAHVPPRPKEKSDSKLDMDKFFSAPTGAESISATRTDDGWPTRAGVAVTLKAIGEALAFDAETSDTSVHDAFSFLVEHGLADYSARVRGHMLAAGVAIIAAYGGGSASQFVRPCEAVMAEKPRPSEDAQCMDWRREGVVVFMGCAAKHLDKGDPKVASIVQTLVGALATPSEAVQIAVSDCLAPLMKIPVVKDQGPELLKELLSRCVGGRSYGERRGAAFGVAAVVKGLGIASIKKHQVIGTLEAACKGSSFQGKQGALCAFECMCVRLGLLFEPYVIVILPHLLKCFGDSSNYVREAAHDCARAIMSKLSAHGVKLILPSILKSLSDSAWRTKQGAIELLGSMAYCAPRQLADSLPMIVPKLTDAFADTHPKVRDSGRKALEDIGSVIRNPEVASLSMTLMSALSDPSKYTRGALEALLACEFMHSIDAPSLALLVPVLQRGLKDRSADVKRKAALITGNTCTMISEAKDLLPYLSAILPGLKATCVDPIPDVRATAGKALAALVRGMGEDKVGDVVPWLIETLKAETSSSERSGGAQALSEVLVVLGAHRASSVLNDLLPLAAHPKGAVREGVLWVLCFLPGAMGKDFAPIIPSSLPVVLAGLSDEVEAVREVALRSGQVLVSTHGKTHADQLLPALEDGLFDDNWRIRQSSVQLLGDLLYLIGDTKEVALDEGAAEDDARGSTRAGEAIEEALGLDRRNSILASLYLIRSDTSAVVRQSALQVWKTVVPNTPKALREILPLLISQIVAALASGNADKRTVAGRALGDIVKKLGDQVLPEVVPFLREGLSAGNANMRQGVCLGLAEIMDCATSRQVEEFIDTLVPAIQDALCDPSAEVREQSAQAFHSLYKAVGVRSIEHVVPSLLEELGQEGDDERASSARERAVFGLKEVLQLRPRDLLPYLIPKLVAAPISTAHARALGAVSEVTGGSIHSHLAIIVPAVVAELARIDAALCLAGVSKTQERLGAIKQAASTLVSRVENVGVNWLCNEMTRQISSKDPQQRKWSVWLMEQFLRGTEAEFEGRIPQILKELLQRLVDVDQAVLVAVWSALKALNSRVSAEELMPHLLFARSIIASIVSDARHRKGGGGAGAEFFLPGVNIPKGLEPLLPMYQQGLMYGSPDVREAAASGIGELVDVTLVKYLQPFLIKITGPLIRIVGDRFPPGVKAAILHTLGLLLGKGGPSLKPFVPQLQTTFVKALGDSSRVVRTQGRHALGQLMGLTTRVDPLISDLASGASSASESAIKEAMLEALAEVLDRSGSKASPVAIEHAIQTLGVLHDQQDDAVRAAAARVIGA
ncbi:unnamed protein product, partial [Scytosiphon promiscuus]